MKTVRDTELARFARPSRSRMVPVNAADPQPLPVNNRLGPESARIN